MTRLSTPAAARTRQDAGWLFGTAFRPLFVGASALAALAVPLWLWVLFNGIAEVAGLPAGAWHAHEMVFGFLPAVMAGYLLSATPNWSGHLPASGRPLAVLFALWVAGRLVPLVAPLPAALLTDAAFPLAVTTVLLREARAKAPRTSRHGLMLFPVLAAASIAHRLLAADAGTAALVARIGVVVAVLLISAVGGRLVPSLTRNAVAGRGETRVPEPYGRFDVFVLAAISPALIAYVVAPHHGTTAAALAVAAALQAVRLARWRGWRVRRADIGALHAGYAWVVVGTALAAAAPIVPQRVPADAALHAFTAGAIGTMTLAVMARLAMTRGSGSGAGERLCALALGAVNLAAGTRVLAPMTGDYATLLTAGGVLWTVAWMLFLAAQILPVLNAETRRL